MTRVALSASCVTTLALSGCATADPAHQAVNPSACYGLSSVSFSPPSGAGWSYFEQRGGLGDMIVFIRKGDTPPHGHIVYIAEIHARANPQTTDEMWSMILEPMAQRFDSMKRFDVQTVDVQPSNRFDPPALHYRYTGTDVSAPDKGSHESLALAGHGHVFAHPDKPNVFVAAEFIERGREDQLRGDPERRADEFVEGLAFRPCD